MPARLLVACLTLFLACFARHSTAERKCHSQLNPEALWRRRRRRLLLHPPLDSSSHFLGTSAVAAFCPRTVDGVVRPTALPLAHSTLARWLGCVMAQSWSQQPHARPDAQVDEASNTISHHTSTCGTLLFRQWDAFFAACVTLHGAAPHRISKHACGDERCHWPTSYFRFWWARLRCRHVWLHSWQAS